MVIPRTFEEGDFVLRKAGVNGKNNVNLINSIMIYKKEDIYRLYKKGYSLNSHLRTPQFNFDFHLKLINTSKASRGH